MNTTPSETNIHAMIATGIVKSLENFRMTNEKMNDYFHLALDKNIFKKYENYMESIHCNKIYEILNTYSLLELRNFLGLLIPIVSCSSKEQSAIRNLKSAIKFIEKDLYSTSDEQKNEFDLIKRNQELKNENAKLKNDLELIQNIFIK